MKRRSFLFGVSAAASVGTGVIGTGAVSQITADRNVNLNIVQDSDAYLSLIPQTSSDLVEIDNPPTGKGVIQFDLTEFNDFAVGSGFNKRATTELTDPVDFSGDALFAIRNQTDRDTEVAATTVGGDLEDIRPVEPDEKIPEPSDDQIQIELFDVTDPDRVAIDQDAPRTIKPGGSGIGIGLRIIVPETAQTGNHDVTVLFRATEV